MLWISACLLLLAGVAWFVRPGYLLNQAAGDIDSLYSTYRPFRYRWNGAPYGAPRNDHNRSCIAVSEADPKYKRAELRLRWAEKQRADETRLLQLLGRMALLGCKPNDAVINYQLALWREPHNTSLLLEMGIGLALRAENENRALDYELALENMLESVRPSATPEAQFDAALLFSSIPLPQGAVEEWKKVLNLEASTPWHNEAVAMLAGQSAFLRTRKERMDLLTSSPGSYVAHANEAPASIELILKEAMEKWLPADSSGATHQALSLLAKASKNQYKDNWLADMVQFPESTGKQQALVDLAQASAANFAGEHIRAQSFSASAEKIFRQIHFLAGVLRARIEKVYALDRQFSSDKCLAAVKGIRNQAHQHGYVWIEGQAWLEEVTCLTQTRKVDVTDIRQRAYEWIAQTGYAGLRLRALGFLIENDASFGSRLQIWDRGREGVQAFWNNSLPPLRGYGFYFAMASSARTAGNRQAAIALLEESTLVLADSGHSKLLALISADLAEWESEVGFHEDAAHHFDQISRLLASLDPKETQSYRDEAEVLRAEAETAAGSPQSALERLQKLTQGMNFPYLTLNAAIRRRLLPAYGNALRTLKEFDRAATYYNEAVSESRSELTGIQNQVQRENAYREMEPAWRGLVETNLWQHEPAKALTVWETFRSGRSTDSSFVAFRPPPGTTLLAYAFLPRGLSAWIVDSNGIEQYWIERDVAQEAAQFSMLVSDRDSSLPQVRQLASRLYAALIQPLARHLPTQGALIIDVDGPLANIPWMALEDPNGEVLAARFSVSQVVGWAEALSGTAVNLDHDKLLIVSEPFLGENLSRQLPPLGDARRIARQLQRRFPNAVFFENREATLANVMEYLPRSTQFYFAGHGLSNGGLGALLLSAAPSETAGARRLIAKDIQQLNLHTLQLVVLAACSSGVGEQSGAVNLDSLVRGFLEGGASRVVAARWNVSYWETSSIIETFYAALLKGQRPAEALRQAALGVRNNPSTSHPYFWASFQVFGTP